MALAETETLAPNVDLRDLYHLEQAFEGLQGSRAAESLLRFFDFDQACRSYTTTLHSAVNLVLPMYSTLILLYRGSGKGGDQRDRLVGLKSSLSKVLVEFYPMAGRLVKVEGSDRPSINCNDCGVIWNETYTDAELAVVEDHYPSDQLLGIPVREAGPGPFYRATNGESVPVLAIQELVCRV